MALAPGARLGVYEIVSRIGAGGMGEVFRARDTRLGRDIALKVLPEAFARDPDRLARFEREARTVAALSHPNIVTIHSIEDDGGTRFLTMELLEGESLDHRIVPGGLPIARVLELAVPFADALAAAHERGVIHRDLKPANLVVSKDGRLKVLDFGLAKPAGEPSSLDSTQAATIASPLSSAGVVMGTAPYMSPEQARGEPLDGRSDLFSFGAILYELLSGRRPFHGATPADVLSAILRDTPEPLPQIRRDVPADLAAVVSRCLQKSAGARFANARDLHDELRRIQRTLESGSAGVGAAADVRRSIAVLPFRNMSNDPENEFFSDGLSEELLNALAKIPELQVTGRTSAFAFKGRDEDLRTIGQKLGVSSLLEGSVRKAGNRVRITVQLIKSEDGFHLWSETFDRVLDDIFAVQDDIARSVTRALQVRLAAGTSTPRARDAAVFEAMLRAKHLTRQHSATASGRAVEIYRTIVREHPGDAMAWAGLASALNTMGSYGFGDPESCIREARECVARALELDDELADAHLTHGQILLTSEFRPAAARDELRRAVELGPHSAAALALLAICDMVLGDRDSAGALLKRAREMDPLDPALLMHSARFEIIRNNYPAAIRMLVEAESLSPGMVNVRSSRGLILLLSGQREGVLELIEGEPSEGYRLYALAAAHHMLGNSAASDAAMAKLVALGDTWSAQIAVARAARGETDLALDALERGYEVRDSGIMFVSLAPLMERVRAEPRWHRLREKLGIPA